jgi:hypothetical protein
MGKLLGKLGDFVRGHHQSGIALVTSATSKLKEDFT